MKRHEKFLEKVVDGWGVSVNLCVVAPLEGVPKGGGDQQNSITMKAITTKYLGFTNTKPSRIKATAEGVKPLTISVESVRGNRLDDPHIAAAKLLCERQGWSTALASGGTANPNMWVHCFIPAPADALIAAARVLATTYPQTSSQALQVDAHAWECFKAELDRL